MSSGRCVALADISYITVGKSRPQTGNKPPPAEGEANEGDANTLGQQKTITNGNVNKTQHDTPFTQEELNRALSKN
jgi:hypothetical protein